MKFDNKVIVVTGAGGGLGREMVRQLIEKGASVAAVDINEETLEETKRLCSFRSGKISTHITDITDPECVSNLPKEVLKYHGHINGLINNAGIIQPFITIAEMKESVFHRLMNINFYGMIHMTRAFIPHLARADEAFIGNVSSMGGFLPVPGQSIYGASKAAVKIATEGLRLELSQTSVKVSLIIPGGIETDIKKNSGLKEEADTNEQKKTAGLKLTKPRDAALRILSGLEKGKAKILIGRDAAVMDFLYRLMPRKAGEMIAGVMSANHGGIYNTTEALIG